MYSPSQDFKQLDELPVGILIRPFDSTQDQTGWFVAALKVSPKYWVVTGHEHIVRSVHLERFADSWQIVYPSQLTTVWAV